METLRNSVRPNKLIVSALAASLALGVSACRLDGSQPSGESQPAATSAAPVRPSPEAAKHHKAIKKKVPISYYSAYDNDPSGTRDIAYPVIHKKAGGTGTYNDPVTFASPEGKGEYAVGTIIYFGQDHKYYIREDSCGKSWTAEDGC